MCNYILIIFISLMWWPTGLWPHRTANNINQGEKSTPIKPHISNVKGLYLISFDVFTNRNKLCFAPMNKKQKTVCIAEQRTWPSCGSLEAAWTSADSVRRKKASLTSATLDFSCPRWRRWAGWGADITSSLTARAKLLTKVNPRWFSQIVVDSEGD